MNSNSSKAKAADSREAFDMRRHKRMGQQSKAYCKKYISEGREVEPESPLEMELLDISAGGLGVMSPVSLDKGSMLVLNIILEGERYDRVSARVIWEIPTEGFYRQGLIIMNISGRLFTHITKLDNSITTEI